MKILHRILLILLVFITVSKAQLLPVPPVPLAPSNNSTNISLTPTVKWNISLIIGTLSSFRLQVSESPSFSVLALDSAGITADSIRVPQGMLNSKTKYYWRVNASFLINSILFTTPYSTTYNFTTGSFVPVEPVGNSVPNEYKLYSNFPNPFNPSTTIKFDNISSSHVVLSIFDAAGRKVESLLDENLSAGKYEVSWDASRYSSGSYFYRIETENFTDTKKMVLVK